MLPQELRNVGAGRVLVLSGVEAPILAPRGLPDTSPPREKGRDVVEEVGQDSIGNDFAKGGVRDLEAKVRTCASSWKTRWATAGLTTTWPSRGSFPGRQFQ